MNLILSEEINTNRQFNLDLIKALAIILMVVCHPVLQFSVAMAPVNPDFESDFPFFLAVYILGSYMPVAHAFMFAMGVGIVFSSKNSPRELIRRGIFIYILAYVLNFLRYGIYAVYLYITTGVFDEWSRFCMLSQDIFYFAALSLVLTGILKLIKLKEIHIFIISVVMSVVGGFLAFTVDTGSYVLNYMIGHYIVTPGLTSCFTLLNWYIFVGTGLLFGYVIRRVRELDKFYLRLLIVSSVVAAVYVIITLISGESFFMSKKNDYYALSLPESIGLLSIDFAFLSAFHFVREEKIPKAASVIKTMSKNVMAIYMIHWIIIGNVDCWIIRDRGVNVGYPLMYVFGIVLIVLSYLLAKLWADHCRSFFFKP